MKKSSSKLVKKASKKAGLSPGSLVYTGNGTPSPVSMSVMTYDKNGMVEKKITDASELRPHGKKSKISWINVNGVHDARILEQIGKSFDIHPLVLEDIMTDGQRPKVEDFESHLFVVLKMLSYDEAAQEINIEQMSFIVGPNFVISFQQFEGDIFDSIRERIRKGKGRVRASGSDYLAYALLDTIVDHYFVILEKLGEDIEELEEKIVRETNPESLQTLHKLKREVIFLRKAVWPLREVIAVLERVESKVIKKKTSIYLRDVYDHTIQVIDTVETFRDMLSGLLDIYLSSASNKMNEIMKVLTVIATVFIPLTFVTGVYGMNFKHMPELEWALGYPLVWGIMVLVALMMTLYFRKKNWL